MGRRKGEGRGSERKGKRKVGGGLGQGPHHTNKGEKSEEKVALPAVGEAITWCLVTAPPLERLREAASASQKCSRQNTSARPRGGVAPPS